ncbi:MAG: rhodanese-related sulfurtransferase [Thermoproteota archaeon]
MFGCNQQLEIESTSLAKNYEEYIILDAREENEYKTSFLKDAKLVNDSIIHDYQKEKYKNSKFLIYCTVGVRSLTLTKVLREKGMNAFNLKGGIFEWTAHGFLVYKANVNREIIKTNEVHTYNKEWSKKLKVGKAVY